VAQEKGCAPCKIYEMEGPWNKDGAFDQCSVKPCPPGFSRRVAEMDLDLPNGEKTKYMFCAPIGADDCKGWDPAEGKSSGSNYNWIKWVVGLGVSAAIVNRWRNS